MRTAFCGLVGLALLATMGCQKLNYEKTISIDIGEVQSILIDAPKRDQKVSVAISSPDSAVNVCVVLEKDQGAAKKSLLDGKKPAEALANKDKVKDDTLEASIPGGSDFAVLLSGAAKSTQVKVKITGR